MAKYEMSCKVVPQFLPEQSAPEQAVHTFAYTVTVTNTGSVAAQLISRHWIICDARGLREEVQGLGVVGQQPLLRPGESFEYTSGCRLRTPSGTMPGSAKAGGPCWALETTAPCGNRARARNWPSRATCWWRVGIFLTMWTPLPWVTRPWPST
jgi:ApaG protein